MQAIDPGKTVKSPTSEHSDGSSWPQCQIGAFWPKFPKLWKFGPNWPNLAQPVAKYGRWLRNCPRAFPPAPRVQLEPGAFSPYRAYPLYGKAIIHWPTASVISSPVLVTGAMINAAKGRSGQLPRGECRGCGKSNNHGTRPRSSLPRAPHRSGAQCTSRPFGHRITGDSPVICWKPHAGVSSIGCKLEQYAPVLQPKGDTSSPLIVLAWFYLPLESSNPR
jgi:hypothetical protein